MQILESSFLLTSCNEGKMMTEDELTRCLQQMQIRCPRNIIAKQIDKFKFLIFFRGPVTTTLFHTLSTDIAGVQLPFGTFLVKKWTTSAGATSSVLSQRNDIRITGLPTEFYSQAIIEDILGPHCMLENNSQHVGDSPDVFFYDCAIWTDENRDIPEIISIWVAPDGLVVEPSPVKVFRCLWSCIMQEFSANDALL
uniref:Uncharacterized protein n=2 Tax=Aegilops tauschii TaxID=37682 RepID=A0A453S9A9_AEGTS